MVRTFNASFYCPGNTRKAITECIEACGWCENRKRLSVARIAREVSVKSGAMWIHMGTGMANGVYSCGVMKIWDDILPKHCSHDKLNKSHMHVLMKLCECGF